MTRMHTAGERPRADWTVLAAIALAGACLGATVREAAAQPAFQAAPVLRANELLPPDMIAGPLFRVDDRVPTDGLLGHFTLRSSLGVFVAPGRELLRIRIAELPAILSLHFLTVVDLALSMVILFLLGGLSTKALILAHDRGNLRLLRRWSRDPDSSRLEPTRRPEG